MTKAQERYMKRINRVMDPKKSRGYEQNFNSLMNNIDISKKMTSEERSEIMTIAQKKHAERAARIAGTQPHTVIDMPKETKDKPVLNTEHDVQEFFEGLVIIGGPENKELERE